jgi:hypothetical protein
VATTERRRLVRATVASAATGAAIYALVFRVVLPMIEARLTLAHVEWLRQAFDRHPTLALGAIVVIAAVLTLPVLGVFRLTYGPLRTSSRHCA